MLCDNYQFPALLFAKQSILVFWLKRGEQFQLKSLHFVVVVKRSSFFFTPQNLLNGSSFCILGKLMNSRTFDEFGTLFSGLPSLFFQLFFANSKELFGSVFLNDLSQRSFSCHSNNKKMVRWCLRKHCPIFLVLKYCQNFSFHLVNIARDPKKGTKNI